MLACCAFAVILLNQLLWPLAFIRERLFGKAALRPNAAVEWRPGDTLAAKPARRGGLRPALAAILLLETLAIGGSVAAATLAVRAGQGSAEQRLEQALHTAICRAIGRTAS